MTTGTPPTRAARRPVRTPAPRRPSTDRVVLELLTDVAQLVARSLDLDETLRRIADAVVASLGFEAAVVNLVGPEGVAVTAIAGPAEIHEALGGGVVEPLGRWLELLAMSRPLGSLRFIDGREQGNVGDLLAWVPDLPENPDPNTWHPMDALFAPLYGTDGDLVGILSVDLPVDGLRPGPDRIDLMERFARQAELAIDRARMHRQLADSEELFRRSFESTPVGMALVDRDGRLLQVNQAFAALLGQSVADMHGRVLDDVTHPKDRDGIRVAVRRLLNGDEQVISGDVRGANGRWGRAHACRIVSRQGTRVLIHVQDITEMRRSREALRRKASTDSLTGALNRDALHDRLGRLARRSADTTDIALMFVDLDLFKLVNDSHGHNVGDRVLRTVAQRMRQELRKSDLLCRFGGDEFVVCLTRINGPAQAIEVADRLLVAISEPLEVFGTTLQPTASVGITVGPLQNGDDVDRMLSEADSALYRAKEAGRARWELFQTWMSESDQERLGLRGRLSLALERHEMRLHYQPIVDLQTWAIVGYEALLRWEHPERGLLPPAEFLHELFHGPLAAAATDWVIERAVTDAALWNDGSDRCPWVSVNVEPRQLTRPDFADRIVASLRRHGLPPSALLVELTEQRLPAGERVLSQLRTLRDAGVGIAIDDLGSGYSGLLTLRHVPATVVKLDLAFSRTVHEPTTAAIVRAVADLARALGITVIAEGIEQENSASVMSSLGVPLGQGYQFGRPIPLTSGADREVIAPLPALSGDFDAERRKLAAALALATDPRQVAEVALQAASRVAGIAGGRLMRISEDGRQLETVFTQGYPPKMAERFRVVDVDTPLPLPTAVRTGAPVFWEVGRARKQLASLIALGEYPFSVAGLPLVVIEPDGTSRTWGALGVSWSSVVEITQPVSTYLIDLAAQITDRLTELEPARI